jgi:hypothetical protein
MDFSNLRSLERRQFLKWSSMMATLLGVERARHLEVLHKLGGYALADTQSAAAKIGVNVNFVAGNGGLANWTLVFPVSGVATTANAQYSSHAPGKGVKSALTDKNFWYSPEMAPVFASRPKSQQVTAYVAGINQAHTGTPAQMLGAGNSLVASLASIQLASTTLIPSLIVGQNGQLFGAAAGAPAPAVVPNAQGIVGIFSSEASKTLLATESNAKMMEQYHRSFTQLQAASRSPTAARGFASGKVAVKLLGEKVGTQLVPSTAELALYGIDGTTPGSVRNMATALITSMKAMALGLTNQISMPSFNDDPHGMFAGGDANAMAVSVALAKMVDGMWKHGDTLVHPASGRKISEKMLVTITGDTTKEHFARDGWGDGSPNNTNIMYVIGSNGGYLKNGWFGDIPSDPVVMDFDPVAGTTVARGAAGSVSGAGAFASAASAVAYAIAGGDERRVTDFGRAEFKGLVNTSLT